MDASFVPGNFHQASRGHTVKRGGFVIGEMGVMRFGIPNLLALIAVISVFLGASRYGIEGPILVMMTFGPLVFATLSMIFQRTDPSRRRVIVYAQLGVVLLPVSVSLTPMFAIMVGLWWMPQLSVVEALHKAAHRDFAPVKSRPAVEKSPGVHLASEPAELNVQNSDRFSG